MGIKLISVLGTGSYKDCIYELEGYRESTAYIQKMLYSYLEHNQLKPDKFIILLTERSRAMNWQGKLSKVLEDISAPVEDKNIPLGASEEEIWDIFQSIYDSLDPGDEVYFDITHSLRSLPMLIMIALNYARVTKAIKVRGIFYGAYEARRELEGIEITPVFNLMAYNQILEWSQAVDGYLNFGNASRLKELSYNILLPKIKEKNKQALQIRSFVESLNIFTETISTCRGMYIDKFDNKAKKSVMVASNDMRLKLKALLESNNNELKPLTPLFQLIDNDTAAFTKENNLTTGLAIIDWSIKNNLIQQAFTALEETLKTYLCLRYDFNDTDRFYREKVVSMAITIAINGVKSAEGYRVDEDYKQKIFEIAQNLEKELVCICDKAKQYRNDINHFGFRDDAKDSNKFKEEIIVLFNSFLQFLKENPLSI